MCSGTTFGKSWLGTVEFNGYDFEYLKCLTCASFICDPMPNESDLLEMYGTGYFEEDTSSSEDISPRKFEEVIAFLRSRQPSVFIDFGCGDGSLLETVAQLGWTPIGIEFDPKHVEQLSAQLPFEIVGHTDTPSELANVLHLGDVLEHLTELDEQLPRILSLLNDNGFLVAHGPLEANPNIFNFALSMSRRYKRNKITSIPPYHVILATTAGQKRLFERNQLVELDFRVKEVAFPAAEKLTPGAVTNPRQVALYAIRKVSQLATRLLDSEKNGNRYFYVGCKTRMKNG